MNDDRYEARLRMLEMAVAEAHAAWEEIEIEVVSERKLDTRPFAHPPPTHLTVNNIFIQVHDMSTNKRVTKRRDTFSTKAENSQVAVAGHKGKATATKKTKVGGAGPLDLGQLTPQLAALRALAKQQQSGEVAHDKAIAALGDAEEAAKKGNEKGVLKHLGTACKLGGKWLYDLSIKVGGDLLRDTVKSMIGLPPTASGPSSPTTSNPSGLDV